MSSVNKAAQIIWIVSVSEAMAKLYGLKAREWAHAVDEYDYVTCTPKEWARWFAEKYDLTQLPMSYDP